MLFRHRVHYSAFLFCLAVLAPPPALAQTVTITPATISFGNQALGTISSAQKVTLKNGQSLAITVNNIIPTLSDYVQTNNCPVSPAKLAAAATCTISITFNPGAMGSRTGSLVVTDSGTNSPQKVSLSGAGIAASLLSIAVTPNAPSVPAGETQQFTATGTYSDGTTQNLTSTVTWTASPATIAKISSSGLATSVATGTATITATSGTIKGSGKLTVIAAVLQSVAVTPASPSVAAGNKQQFTATGTYSNGTTKNLTSSAAWSSSATSIATVSSGGLATSAAQGSATITATSGTISGSTTLTVTAPVLASIAVTPSTPSVAAGEMQQLTATGTYSDGTTQNLTNSAAWTTSSATIATVNGAGLVTSVAVGTATITATSGTIKGSAKLTVIAAVLQSVAITPASASVAAGNKQQFTATGTYSNGTTKNLTSSAAWSSSATSIATISSGGLAATAAQGSTTITATSSSISGSATLTVTAPSLISIAISPSTTSVPAGETQQFMATGTYGDGTTQNLTSTAMWTTSSPAIATVSGSGLATSLANGTATITATSGTIKGSAKLTVPAPLLTSIAVTPSPASIPAGQNQQFTATGTYGNGTTQNLTRTATWSSSATAIATVNSGGLAIGAAQGSTTITATSGTISGSTTLTVTAPVLVSLSVGPGNASIAKGTSQQFTATGTYSDGSAQDNTSAVSWSSSSSAVASIAGGGLATGEGAGTATITATLGSITGAATLNVGQAVLVSIAVTPANASFALGTTLPLVATGTYSDGSTLVVTNTATWTADQTIATVNNQGVASSVALGSTTVTATLGTISGSTTVTVNPAVLVSIAVTPAVPVIPMGTTQAFTATGTYTDGSTQNITSTVDWSSDTPGVSTITTGGPTPGVATSVATGNANITATSGSVSGTTTLTVTAAVLVTLTVTPATPSIALGTTQQFTATGTFTDGSTQDLTSTATWASDTTATATINTAGLVQSAGIGTATVSATSGSVSGSTLLTVTAAALVSIAINPPTATIPLGTTQQFTATGTFTDGTTQDLTQSGHWSSTAANVATISNTPGTNGLATTLTTGTTTIGISSASVSATATLVVNPAALVSIAINPPSATIALGTTQQFTATGNYTDNSTQDLTSVVTWSSSAATVAVISNTNGSYGLATSAGQGTANITASFNTISSGSTISVSAPTLVSIAITPSGAAIPLGTGQQFNAVGTYTDGSTQDLTQSATWTSSVQAVAIMGAAGYASSVHSGSTNISATSGSVSGSVGFTVTAPVLVMLSVSPGSVSIVEGTNEQFTATGTYSDGSMLDLTAAVNWSSSSSIASVASGGLASGQGVGTTTITAILGLINGSATLNVAQALAMMQTPAPGSTISGNAATFTWTADSYATAYRLDIGSSAGANDIYSSGNLGNALSASVLNLPANGNTIYVSLFSMAGGQWVNNPYTYVSQAILSYSARTDNCVDGTQSGCVSAASAGQAGAPLLYQERPGDPIPTGFTPGTINSGSCPSGSKPSGYPAYCPAPMNSSGFDPDFGSYLVMATDDNSNNAISSTPYKSSWNMASAGAWDAFSMDETLLLVRNSGAAAIVLNVNPAAIHSQSCSIAPGCVNMSGIHSALSGNGSSTTLADGRSWSFSRVANESHVLYEMTNNPLQVNQLVITSSITTPGTGTLTRTLYADFQNGTGSYGGVMNTAAPGNTTLYTASWTGSFQVADDGTVSYGMTGGYDWQASWAVTVTDTFILPTAGNSGNYGFQATTGGVTGTTAPTWCATTGCTVTDGTVVWTNIGKLGGQAPGFDVLIYRPPSTSAPGYTRINTRLGKIYRGSGNTAPGGYLTTNDQVVCTRAGTYPQTCNLPDRFTIHEVSQPQNGRYVELDPTSGGGANAAGNWNSGTLSCQTSNGVWSGPWSSTATYTHLDVVTYNGQYWNATTAKGNTNQPPPSSGWPTGNTYWTGTEAYCNAYLFDTTGTLVAPDTDWLHGSGHGAAGYLTRYWGAFYRSSLYSDPVINGLLNPDAPMLDVSLPCDDHGSYRNSGINDLTPMFTATTDVPAWSTRYDVPNGACYDEICAFNSQGSGLTYRFGHAFNTGSSFYFQIQNNIGVVSPFGDLFAFGTDMMGNRGANSGPATACNNLRGQYQPSPSGVVTYQDYVYPITNNASKNIFRATGCGTNTTGAACKEGASLPNWDSACSTSCTDGGVTWTNEGPNSCRGDVVILDTLSAHASQ